MLDYLAVCPQARGTGAGTAILEKIRTYYADKKILLLIEELNPAATNIEQRVKRKRFYLRNGYIDTGIRTSSIGGNMEILSA